MSVLYQKTEISHCLGPLADFFSTFFSRVAHRGNFCCKQRYGPKMPALENEFLDLLDVLHIIDVVDFDT